MRREEIIRAGDRGLRCEIWVPDRVGETARVPGILLLHEIFGLVEYVRDDARRLAEEGYLVVVPDLFSEGGRTRYCMKQFFDPAGLANRGESSGNREIGDLLDALAAHPRCNGRIGMIGQCLTGGFVLQMARRPDMAAPVLFHHSLGVRGGGIPAEDAREVNGPLLGHFAAFDPVFCPARKREKLKSLLGQRLQAHVYEGVGHGIRSVYRNRPQSDRAWNRTLEFFDQQLRGAAATP